MTVSIGLLVLRLALGLVLIGHACQKLFGWFSGPGLAGTAAWFDLSGYRPGRAMALLAGACELIGGAALVAGVSTPVAAAVVLGVMLAAAAVHAPHGLWARNGGFELPALYALAAVALAWTGAGDYSVDGWLDASWGWQTSAIATAVGTAAGLLAIVTRAAANRTRQPERATDDKPRESVAA